MLAEIIIEQTMFDLIEILVRFVGHLFEPDTDRDGAADIVAQDAGSAALAAFQSGELYGFPVKLLNLPAQAAHLLYRLLVSLSQIVGHDIVRALGRQHDPEQFHFVLLRKAFEPHPFALLPFAFRPGQAVNPPVGVVPARIIHLPVVLERAVIDFVQAFDEQHQVSGGVPNVHQPGPKAQLLVIDRLGQRVLHMLQFGLAIPIRVINAILDDPKLVECGVDIHVSHPPDAFDQPVGIATVLPSHQIHAERVVYFHEDIVKHQVSIRHWNYLAFHVFPHQAGGNFLLCQIAVDGIIAKLLGLIGKIGQGVVDLTAQQILAIIQSVNREIASFHTDQNTRICLSLSS